MEHLLPQETFTALENFYCPRKRLLPQGTSTAPRELLLNNNNNIIIIIIY